MTERFSLEAIETLRARLVLREAQSEATRTRPKPVRDAVIGFFCPIAAALAFALLLGASFQCEQDVQALGLRGATLPEEIEALFAEADVVDGRPD